MSAIASSPAGNWIKPTAQFCLTILRANYRNWKALAVTLGMPLFMLFTIWAPATTGDAESQELMQMLFPAIILLSVIMPGLTQATRKTQWKEQQIFKRFALTPVPLPSLIAAAALTQIAVGIGQGTLILVFGVFLVGLALTWQSALLVLGCMALAGAAFIAFGTMIAAFSQRADIAGYVFFFTIMPLTFLASFPPEMLPETINAATPWLPTSMALELIGGLFVGNHLPEHALMAALGLLGYTLVFSVISNFRKFQ